ncbi:hypothetical protein ABI59_06745 [Acidobacteria bacterium Mor1]|nr:hypothetical protein ABI59_06745 [Acidobacteria bacterium Mor1]
MLPAQRKEAIALLKASPFVLIDRDTAARLLERPELSADAQLYEAAARATERADRLQRIALTKAGEEQEKWLRREDEERRTVERALTLRGRLEPYLARAVAYRRYGIHGAYWLGDDLVIGNSALGGTLGETLRDPVVIFLEREPRRLYTEASLAE